MFTLSRRHFLTASAGTLAGLGTLPARRVLASTPVQELAIVTRVLEVNGKSAKAYGLVGPDNQPGLTFNAGDQFRVRLQNRLSEPSLIHWHGLTPPNAADGVPGMTQPPLAAGASYDYDFALTRPGTNFMHSHLGLQEQKMLAAPLIIRDPAEAQLDEQEVVILLHDFTFREPQDILAELQKGMSHGSAAQSGGHDMSQMDMSGIGQMGQGQMGQGQMGQGQMDHSMMGHDMSQMGKSSADELSRMDMGHDMAGMQMGNMAGMDINDVRYDAFLANDRTLADPEIIRVERGGRVRLRVINAAASSNFMVDLGRLSGSLIAVDGMPVQPSTGNRFALAVGQRLDLRLDLPKEKGAWPVLAQLEGDRARTGIVLAATDATVSRLGDQADQAIGRIDDLPGHLVGAAQPLAVRPADRRLTLNLTGDMMRYRWGLGAGDGAQMADPSQTGANRMSGGPLLVKEGERVEIEMINRTAMSHPMHLHGHHFQLVAVDGKPVAGPRRDTHLVPAGGRATIAFDADNPGRWALHCHNLYHMVAGMMTELRYA